MERRVLSFNYTLKNKDGNILDASENEPLTFLEGGGQIIPLLEKSLAGMLVGEKKSVTLDPKDGYGEFEEQNIIEIPKKDLSHLEIQEGVHLQMQMGEQVRVVRIVKIGIETVTLDGNHPLAGVELYFDVELMSVRPATADELAHGHAHGPGGHQHGH